MPGPKFDINDGDFIFGDDNLGFDSEGHIMLGIGDNMSAPHINKDKKDVFFEKPHKSSIQQMSPVRRHFVLFH